MAEKYCYDTILMNSFGAKRMWDKRRQEKGQTQFFFQTCPFWGIYQTNPNTHIRDSRELSSAQRHSWRNINAQTLHIN
jgi:hypothetical protein